MNVGECEGGREDFPETEDACGETYDEEGGGGVECGADDFGAWLRDVVAFLDAPAGGSDGVWVSVC